MSNPSSLEGARTEIKLSSFKIIISRTVLKKTVFYISVFVTFASAVRPSTSVEAASVLLH